MSQIAEEQEQALIDEALRAARDTQFYAAEPGIRHRAAGVFSSVFGPQEAVIVADRNTYEAAGREVEASFSRENHPQRKPFTGPDPDGGSVRLVLVCIGRRPCRR